jgi:hypothetical protein
MPRKILLIILTTLFLLSVTTATAAENVEKAKVTSNYTITQSPDAEIEIVDEDMGILTVYDTISQGETNLHEKTVSSGLNLLVVDLNWGDSTDSLRLKLYTPGGVLLGTYYDNADGITDGRIHLYIQNPNGIEAGTWKYQVYGYRVTGTEDYTI